MGDQALQHRTYQRAADIADKLLAWGLPVTGFMDFDAGHAVGIAFARVDRKPFALRLSADKATPELFRELHAAAELAK